MRVPVELIIQIIENLPFDRHSSVDRVFLSRCSTLSRALLAPCQRRLFSAIYLFSYKGASRCRTLHDVLTQSPHLASLIRTLVIQNGWSTLHTDSISQKVMWALTESSLPQVLDMLSALQFLYLNSSTTEMLKWSDMGPALQTSFLRLFTLSSLTSIRLRNLKVPPTVFSRSFQLADFSLFRSRLDPSDHPELPSISPVMLTPPNPDRPRLRSLSITSEVADAVLEHLSAALDISCLEELILTDADFGLDAVANIVELCTSSLVRFVWIFPKFSEFSNLDPEIDQEVVEANPLTLSSRLKSLEVSVWDWLNDRETLSPFTWVLLTLRNLKSQPGKPNLEEITLGITVDPFYQYDTLVQSQFWDDLDTILATGDTFSKLRRVTAAIYHQQPPDDEEIMEQWTTPMARRLPRIGSLGILCITDQVGTSTLRSTMF